jgi:Na+-transporting NADH:ubiquinone oxidoreductase subunit E
LPTSWACVHYLAVSKKVKTAFGLGLAVIFVLGVTIPINWLIQNYIQYARCIGLGRSRVCHIDLSFLTVYCFHRGYCCGMVQLTEMAVEKFSPALYGSLGIFLPLIAVNCAILGGSLFMVGRPYNLLEASVYGLGSGIGWLLAIVALAGVREKMKYSNVPGTA